MSKAIKISFSKKVYDLLAKVSSIVRFNSCSIPSIPDMSLPELPSLSSTIPSMAYESSKFHIRESEKKQHTIDRENLHFNVISLLEKSGYQVSDVKSLPSGENRITLSDLFNDYKDKQQEYACVDRREIRK